MSDNSDLFAILLKGKKRTKLMKAQMLLIMSLMTILKRKKRTKLMKAQMLLIMSLMTILKRKKRTKLMKAQMLLIMSLMTILKRKKRTKLMKAQMLLIMSLMTIPDPRNSICRSVRRNVRNTGWWQLVWNTYNDKRFKETFRVTRHFMLEENDKK